ncbi:MAG: dienelactone hydrolase family protein [Rhodospirillaceae bacterium]|nr:dienelactone hydrolase family protein [Rhodospirillaceae bacterium]
MSAPASPTLAPAQGSAAESAVIFLHGYGSNGDDLIGLAPFFAQTLPKTVFYSPNAPEPWEGGFFGGRQWFTLAGYDPEALRRQAGHMKGVYDRMFEGAVKASAFLNTYIDQTMAHHKLPASKVALIGFSQGTMMALHAGLRRAESLAAIVGFSGAMVGASKLAAEIKSRPPVLLVHGEDDPVVPVEALPEIEKALKANNVPCDALTIPGLQHGIEQTGALRAAAFLKSKLS